MRLFLLWFVLVVGCNQSNSKNDGDASKNVSPVPTPTFTPPNGNVNTPCSMRSQADCEIGAQCIFDPTTNICSPRTQTPAPTGCEGRTTESACLNDPQPCCWRRATNGVSPPPGSFGGACVTAQTSSTGNYQCPPGTNPGKNVPGGGYPGSTANPGGTGGSFWDYIKGFLP